MDSFDVGMCDPAATDGPSARFRRNLAVVIGIDTYGEGISPLRSAVADARAIAEALERDHRERRLAGADLGEQRPTRARHARQ